MYNFFLHRVFEQEPTYYLHQVRVYSSPGVARDQESSCDFGEIPYWPRFIYFYLFLFLFNVYVQPYDYLSPVNGEEGNDPYGGGVAFPFNPLSIERLIFGYELNYSPTLTAQEPVPS